MLSAFYVSALCFYPYRQRFSFGARKLYRRSFTYLPRSFFPERVMLSSMTLILHCIESEAWSVAVDA
jgi:hypothetical protein